MKGSIEKLVIDGLNITLYLPPGYGEDRRYSVVYVNGSDELPDIFDALERHINIDIEPFILVNIEAADWNGDMTPWPAPAIFKKGGSFAGHADSYLDQLVTKIKPHIDANYDTLTDPRDTGLLGYSLGGLAALYALYRLDAFGKIGSLSGSLWYDRWLEFVEENIPKNKGALVYMSLGIKESESNNPRMSAVGSCTLETVEQLNKQLTDEKNICLQWNNGGHFTEIPQRYISALLWLMTAQQ